MKLIIKINFRLFSRILTSIIVILELRLILIDLMIKVDKIVIKIVPYKPKML